MKKRILSMLLTVVMMAVLLSTAALAETVPTVLVGGVEMYSAEDVTYYKNGDTATPTGTADDWNAKYEPVINTLTIKNLLVTGANNTNYGAGVYSNCALNIVLEGANSITGGDYTTSHGIMVDADLEIRGSGALSVTGGDGDQSSAIFAQGTITIKGGVINATGGTVNNYENAVSCGIRSYSGDIVINGGTVVATGGSLLNATDASSAAAGSRSHGIYVSDTSRSFSCHGGVVVARSGIAKANSSISADPSKVLLSGSKVAGGGTENSTVVLVPSDWTDGSALDFSAGFVTLDKDYYIVNTNAKALDLEQYNGGTIDTNGKNLLAVSLYNNSNSNDYSYGIYAGRDKTLNVTGSGTVIAVSGSGGYNFGICAATTVSDTATVTAIGTVSTKYSCGILGAANAGGSAQITAIGGQSTDSASYGIDGFVTVNDTAAVTAVASKAKGNSYGIDGSITGGITVNGGKLNTIGGAAGYNSTGIFADSNTVTIAAGTAVNAVGEDYGLSLYSEASEFAAGSFTGGKCGIYASSARIDAADLLADGYCYFVNGVAQQPTESNIGGAYDTVTIGVTPTYTVTFDKGDGTITGDTSKTVTFGEAYGTLPTASTTAEDMSFGGWWLKNEYGYWDIQVTPDTIVTAGSDHTLYARYGQIHPICGAECSDNAEHENILWTAISTAEELLAINSDGHYYLTADITLENIWAPDAYDVALDLNGHTLTGRVAVGSYQYFTLTDCKGTGQLRYAIENAAVLSCEYSATFNQYGGTIENTAENGNGIYVYDYHYYGGTVTADQYAVDDAYTIYLYQTPDIRGGTADFYAENYLPTFIIQAELELPAEACTVDFMDNIGTFTLGWDTYMSEADCTRFFTSVNAGTFVEKDVDGELQLTALAFTQQPAMDNDYTAAVNDPNSTWQWYELGTKVFTVVSDQAGEDEISVIRSVDVSYDSSSKVFSLGNSDNPRLTFGGLFADDIVTVTFDEDHSGTVSGSNITFGAKEGNTWTGTVSELGGAFIEFINFSGGETFTITVTRKVHITELTGRTGASLLTRSENALSIMDGKEYACVVNGVIESEPVEFVHVHGGWTYSYAADGNGYGSIIATCGNEGCPLNGGAGTATCRVIIDSNVEYKYSGYTCPVDVDTPTTESDWYNAGLACPRVESYGLNPNSLTGSATITVDGEEACTVPFTLQKRTLTAADITAIPPDDRIYSGSAKEVDVIAPDDAKHLVSIYCVGENVVNGEPVDAGFYLVKANVAESDYYNAVNGLNIGYFDIAQKDITADDVTFEAIPDQYYTGSEVQPKPVIKYNGMTLVEDTDYIINAYHENKEIGTNTASVLINGNGNYYNSKTVNFSIVYATKEAGEVLTWNDGGDGWFDKENKPIFTPKTDWTVSTAAGGTYGESALDFSSDEQGENISKTVYVKDSGGNIYQVTLNYKYDKAGFTFSVSEAETPEWSNVSKNIVATVTSPTLSGVKSVELYIGDVKQDVAFEPVDGSYLGTVTANGEYKVKVTDNAGNYGFQTIRVSGIDKTEPSASVSVSGTAGENGWYTSDVTVTISEAGDTDSGLPTEPYSFDGGDNWQSDSTKTYTETTENVVVYIRDNAGNKTGPFVPNINIDKDRPTITGVSGNPTEWTKDDVTLTVNASDIGAAGLAAEAYSFDGGTTWQRDNTKTYAENTADIIIKVRDAAGNITTFDALSITMIDKAEPYRITVGADPHTTGEWYTAKPTIIVGAMENGSGLDAEPYSFDGGQTWQSSDSKEYDEGIHILSVWVRDKVGNIAKCQPLTLKIDTTAPGDISVSAKVGEENYASGSDNLGDVVITLTGGEDALSGFDKFQYKIGEDSWEDIEGGTFTHSESTDENGVSYKFRAVDKAGNASGEVEFTVKKAFSVRFNANGGEGEMGNDTVYVNGAIVVPDCGFTREGYTFTGWNTAADGSGTEYLVGSEIRDIREAPGGGVDVYAQWTVNEYKVTWINYGGDGWEKNFDYGVAITLPTIPDFAIMMHKLGYTQTGWLCSDDTVGIGDTMPAKDLTFTAQYTPNTYTVKFDANGGTGDMADQSFTYDAAAQALTTNAFTRDGYKFMGWAESAEANGVDYVNKQSVSNLTAAPNGQLMLYAVWTRDIILSGDIVAPNVNDAENLDIVLVGLDGTEYPVSVTGTESPYHYTVTVPEGEYQLIVKDTRDGGVTVTVKEELTEDKMENISMPGGNKSSIVDSTAAGDYAPIVGGLDAIAESTEATNVTVTLTMTHEPANEDDAEHDALMDAAGSQKNKLTFFEIDLVKNVDGTETPITETTDPIEIVIPFDTTRKQNFKVYRFHDDNGDGDVDEGEVDILTTTANGDGEYIEVGTGSVTMHAKFFSLYAIGYNDVIPYYPVTHSCTSKCDVCGGCEDAACTENACKDKCRLLGMNFTDVADGKWYTEAVEYVYHHKMMEGVGNDLFDINGTTTRAMIVTILWRLEGEPVVNYLMQFEDIPAETWYTEAVRWAASEGIVTGYSDVVFGPNDPITREQLATILYRYEQHKGGGFTGAWMFLLDYTDRDEVSDWAYEAMCWTTMHGVINGKGDGILDPKGSAKRCEAAQMLMNYLDK